MMILVLEDHPLVALGLEAVLVSEGHEVLGPAATVTQALCLAEQTPPDLALVDIALGDGGNGIEAARALRQRWGVPCLLVSAQSDAARAARETAVGYLQKPVTAGALLRSVDTVGRLVQGQELASIPESLELFQATA